MVQEKDSRNATEKQIPNSACASVPAEKKPVDESKGLLLLTRKSFMQKSPYTT